MAKAPRFDDITPGLASRRAPALAAHRGAQVRFWLWLALAAFGLAISVLTYVLTHGAAVAIWLAPVIIGVVQAARTSPDVREAKRELDAIT